MYMYINYSLEQRQVRNSEHQKPFKKTLRIYSFISGMSLPVLLTFRQKSRKIIEKASKVRILMRYLIKNIVSC
jgi:hypothetical protein